MTKSEKLEQELESADLLLSNFEESIRCEQYKIGSIQAALCAVADTDTPDEYARGQASAYDDAFTRLVRLLADLDVAKDVACDELANT